MSLQESVDKFVLFAQIYITVNIDNKISNEKKFSVIFLSMLQNYGVEVYKRRVKFNQKGPWSGRPRDQTWGLQSRRHQ